MFTQVFGSTTYAVSTVLTAFMAGLALGSYVFGRLIDSYEKWALPLYGILEGGIGLYALSVPFLITLIDSLHAWAYRAYHPSSWVFILMRFVICMAILLIPTTMMGATLPIMSRFVVKQQQTLGAKVGILYGVNTAGAVLGCYCAGFILIGSLGVTRTLHLAVAANGLIMAVALYVGSPVHVKACRRSVAGGPGIVAGRGKRRRWGGVEKACYSDMLRVCGICLSLL